MSKARNRARALLTSPGFFRNLLAALRKEGLVGEEKTVLITYIVGVSRLLSRTLNLFLKGQSSTGKNFVADRVLRLFPPGEVRVLTSASSRSWNYLGGQLEHKIVYVKERNEASGSVHPTRLLVSEKELVHQVTVRYGGEFITEKRVTKGPVACISTTTRDRLEVDDETRNLSVWLDESWEQSKRIMESCLDESGGLSDDELETWWEAQRLLANRADLSIEIPDWFRQLTEHVQSNDVRVRRYFPAFVQACRAMSLIRSFRGPTRQPKSQKKLKLSFSDFANAAIIFDGAFAESLSRPTDRSLETRQVVERLSARNNGSPVRASKVAKALGISEDRAYERLRQAVSAGTVRRANQPTKTNVKLYLPTPPPRFVPDPVELFSKLGLRGHVKFVHPLTGKWVVCDGKEKKKR